MRILVADDDPLSRQQLVDQLIAWHYDVQVARDGDEAWSALQGEDAPKLAILDWVMPGRDGVEICRELRRQDQTSYTYLLLLTVRDRPADKVEGLESGADDYLIKPVDFKELRARLWTGTRIVWLQEEITIAKDLYQRQATHDSLTGLMNHGAVCDLLAREVVRAQRRRTHLGVVMIDLDGFKDINDTHGHQTGDIVLTRATERMKAVVRVYDTLGRYGGDEFLLLLPDCNLEEAVKTSERIHTAVGATPIVTPDGDLTLTVSIGVTSTSEFDAPQPEDLIHDADRALYLAKEHGRNQVQALTGRFLRAAASLEAAGVRPGR